MTKSVVLAFVVLALPPLARAEECVVLSPGDVEVVLPTKPLPIERFAADELTNFLSRVLGAPVPVVGKAEGRRTAILLGRATGFDVSAFERDAFRTKVEIASNGLSVVRIAGRDGKATSSGAYGNTASRRTMSGRRFSGSMRFLRTLRA